MYRYDEFDHGFVSERVAQFADQVQRRLDGDLTEDQFKPLRLMNGVYLQLHAYMLRVAIPYGTLNSTQMRVLGEIARDFDKGYAHWTTRQNLQYNWPKLADIPEILRRLASVEMHAIQTSGNCIRNVTTDHFAGAAADEIDDPRPYAEILRQWSSNHPEFSFLPRKFKIAVTGAPNDRAAIQLHDIGLEVARDVEGRLGFVVWVGGGQGRTPMLAKKIREFLPEEHLLSYIEAILRVYNMYGRRDNKYKARIKILVHETGIETLKADVEAEWERIRDGVLKLPVEEVRRIEAYFAPPQFKTLPLTDKNLEMASASNPSFARWVDRNTHAHKQSGYRSVTISAKPIGGIPGDMSAEQIEAISDLGRDYSFDELRISHEQNVILPHVALMDLKTIFDALVEIDLAEGNIGLITDIIACPGLDYCALATARSIPVAQELSKKFGNPDRQKEIGNLKVKISGCINACGHHHVGHIGILGLDRKGEEVYQITLGGSGDENAAIGTIIGRGFKGEDVADAVETIVDTYIGLRQGDDEPFIDAYRRVGQAPFKEALYGTV
ncbi:MAG: sulfite reductase [Hyphomicrobiales bacterium]|nr:MAG: sulfite reductase [Hyphomicrobiales bacterium]